MTSHEQNVIDKFVAVGVSWRNYGSGIWAVSEKLLVKWALGFVVFLRWSKQTACISSVPWNDVKYNLKLWELGNMVFIIRHSIDANPQFWDPCLNGFEQKWFWEVYWNTMAVDALAPCVNRSPALSHAIDCWMNRSVPSFLCHLSVKKWLCYHKIDGTLEHWLKVSQCKFEQNFL